MTPFMCLALDAHIDETYNRDGVEPEYLELTKLQFDTLASEIVALSPRTLADVVEVPRYRDIPIRIIRA